MRTNPSARFMANNFMGRGFTYSSQQAAFPASNVYHPSRSKVWRPTGSFELVSTVNNYIYFYDGSSHTAIATPGSYTGDELAAEIQTAMNAVPASSGAWVVTFDSDTYKFSFTNIFLVGLETGETAAAIWDTIGFVSVSGSPAISVQPIVSDEPRFNSFDWVKYDTGVPQVVTFVAVLWGIDKALPLSQNAEIRIQLNNIDDWTAPPVDRLVPITDQGAFLFLDDLDDTSYRFGRLTVKDPYNYLGPAGLEIANVYIGDDQTMDATNIATGFTQTLLDPSQTLQSEDGAIFVEIRPRYSQFSSCRIMYARGEEVEALRQLFYDLGVRTPFYLSIDPKTQVSGDLGELTRYVINTRSPTFQHIIRDYYTISFDLREAF